MKSKPPALGPEVRLTLALLAALAFFVYLPGFITRFGLHNDYSFVGYRPTDTWLCYPETMHLFALGRPLGAVLLNVQGLFLGSLSSFAYARLLSFAVFLASIWLVFRHLTERLQVDGVLAAALSFGLLFLPGSQLFIVWLTNFVPGTLNVLIALLVYRLWEKCDLQEIGHGRLDSAGWGAAAMGAFYLSLCIYPPTAFTFLALTFANTLLSPMTDWPRMRLRVLGDLAFTATGAFLYFVANKFVLLPLFQAYGSAEYQDALADINRYGIYQFDLSANLLEKLSEFGSLSAIALGGALHAIVGDPSAWIMGGVMVVAYGFVAWRANRVPGMGSQRRWILQKAILGFLIIFCACSPSLAAQQGVIGYRVATTYAFIALIALFVPLHALSRLVPKFPARPAALALVLISAVLAEWNVSDVARNGSRELSFVQEKLEDRMDDLSTVLAMMRTRGLDYIERPLQQEFAFPMTGIDHLAGAVRGLLPEVGLADRGLTFLYDEGKKRTTWPASQATEPGRPPILLQLVNEGGLIADEHTLLIDLNDASLARPRPKPVLIDGEPTASVPTVQTSNGSGGMGVLNGYVPGEWRPGPAPQWLEITIPKPFILAYVKLKAGPDAQAAGSMPRDWSILASDDEITWGPVDSRKGQDKWQPGEPRKYVFPRVVKATHFLFVFTAGNSSTLDLNKIQF